MERKESDFGIYWIFTTEIFKGVKYKEASLNFVYWIYFLTSEP